MRPRRYLSGEDVESSSSTGQCMSAAIAIAAQKDVIVSTRENAGKFNMMGIPMLRDVSGVRHLALYSLDYVAQVLFRGQVGRKKNPHKSHFANLALSLKSLCLRSLLYQPGGKVIPTLRKTPPKLSYTAVSCMRFLTMRSLLGLFSCLGYH